MSTGCLRWRAWSRLSADTSLVLAGPSLSVPGPSDRSPSRGAVTSQVCCVLGRSSVGWMGQVSHRAGCTQGYTTSPLHSEPTVLATLCPPSAPDSGCFSPVLWVTLALVLPHLWASPASCLHPDRLSKPQPKSVTWASSSRRVVPPNTPLEPLTGRSREHWTNLSDWMTRRSIFKGGAQSPRLASKHTVCSLEERPQNDGDVNGVCAAGFVALAPSQPLPGGWASEDT